MSRLTSFPHHGRHDQATHPSKTFFGLLLLLLLSPCADGIHHMERAPLPWVNRRADTRPLVVTNKCPDTIYPGIGTQAGTAPSTQGFRLNPGERRELTVSADWQGRVWGRTNCSFNAAGTAPLSSGTGVACSTGDCGGTVNCRGTGVIPVTLAEFTLSSSSGQVSCLRVPFTPIRHDCGAVPGKLGI